MKTFLSIKLITTQHLIHSYASQPICYPNPSI